MVDFSNIIIGSEYNRSTLATMWGYKTIDAIRRGVVTPQGKSLVILFITREKHESMTQYEDHIDQDILGLVGFFVLYFIALFILALSGQAPEFSLVFRWAYFLMDISVLLILHPCSRCTSSSH